MSEPYHLGDGLYAKMERGQLVLMANHPRNPSDTVYLDPSVWETLKTWVAYATQEVQQDAHQPDYRDRCHGCGKLSTYVYCQECAGGRACPHGNKVGDCTPCDVEGDLAYDAGRGG